MFNNICNYNLNKNPGFSICKNAYCALFHFVLCYLLLGCIGSHVECNQLGDGIKTFSKYLYSNSIFIFLL